MGIEKIVAERGTGFFSFLQPVYTKELKKLRRAWEALFEKKRENQDWKYPVSKRRKRRGVKT